MDIYFQKEYGIVNEPIEDGKAICKKIGTAYGIVNHMFILRAIHTKINGEQYYDIVSPYGYGGPVIAECEPGKKDALLDAYEREFAEYCREHNIVSEFIRFHPIVGNGVDFQKVYDAKLDRKTVGTNLDAYEDPVSEEFSKSCRKRIRRAIRDGITYRITERPDDISGFKEVYYSTMRRNGAGEYYYFSDDYFERCLKYFRDNIILVEALYEGKVIAAGFYFAWENVIHIHLSGTLSEYLHLSPAYVLRYAVTLWGKEKGYSLIHHGGGRSGDLEDSLYTFKKQFGQNTEFDFYIGRKVWNRDIYEKLCIKGGVEPDSKGYFPAYRQ